MSLRIFHTRLRCDKCNAVTAVVTDFDYDAVTDSYTVDVLCHGQAGQVTVQAAGTVVTASELAATRAFKEAA